MVTPQLAPTHPQQGNGMAVAGMILGIIGLALCWLPFVGWLCALIGIILGALGMSKAKQIGGRGKGMAIAGLICGIIGLMIGVLLFVLATMAMKSFDTYVQKSKRSEASLQLRSMETKIKSFFAEKARLPASGSVMPGPPESICSGPNQRLPAKPQSAWEQAGWREMGFHVDEDSRYAYEWDAQTGVARAIGDLDCDGTMSTTTVTLTVVDGNLVATYADPTDD
jgi:Tfp pilus assembly protein PilE